jgi:hypothetical protein
MLESQIAEQYPPKSTDGGLRHVRPSLEEKEGRQSMRTVQCSDILQSGMPEGPCGKCIDIGAPTHILGAFANTIARQVFTVGAVPVFSNTAQQVHKRSCIIKSDASGTAIRTWQVTNLPRGVTVGG